MTPKPAASLLTRANAITALCLTLLGSALAAASWAYGRGSTEAEQRLAVRRNADLIETNVEAIKGNTEAIQTLSNLPSEIDAIKTRQTAMDQNVQWLVWRAGGVPVVIPTAPASVPPTP